MGVFGGARGNRGATHQMRKVRTETSIRGRSADPMTVHAGIPFKYPPSCDCAGIFGCGFLLSVYPSGKIVWVIDRNAEQHLRVLRSAVLRTLTQKDAWALRVYPHSVGMVGNEVGLACQLRYPETMVGVGREQLQKRRCRMTWIAHRNMQLVCCDDPKLWIAKFPPVLMSNRDHIQSAGRFGRILHRVDYPRGGQEQNNYDEDRNDRPGQLNLHAAIYLSRFTASVHSTTTKLDDGVEQQYKDHKKDDSGNDQYKDRQVRD